MYSLSVEVRQPTVAIPIDVIVSIVVSTVSHHNDKEDELYCWASSRWTPVLFVFLPLTQDHKQSRVPYQSNILNYQLLQTTIRWEFEEEQEIK